MNVRQLSDNLIQITALRMVNAYLVREDDGFTLIDTLTVGWGDDLYRIARDAGGTIQRIALTHGHADHAGSLDALRREARETLTVLIPEADARILAGDRDGFGRLRGMWPKVKTTPDVLLAAGDRVGSLQVVACPGHTPGHIAFFDTRDRSLIAGDAFTTVGTVAVPSHLLVPFPLAAMGTWDRPMALESARALRALDPTLLAAGHGRAVREPAAAIDRAIARAS